MAIHSNRAVIGHRKGRVRGRHEGGRGARVELSLEYQVVNVVNTSLFAPPGIAGVSRRMAASAHDVEAMPVGRLLSRLAFQIRAADKCCMAAPAQGAHESQP